MTNKKPKTKNPSEHSDFKCGVIYTAGIVTDVFGYNGAIAEALSASGINNEQDCIDVGAEEYDYEKLSSYWS